MLQETLDEGGNRAVLISDVAREARVSTATVSRVLSRSAQVRAELRQRVDEAVARLGYTPNAAARSLRAGSSRAILVVTHHRWSAPFFAEVLRGLDAGFAERGYTMILGNLDAEDQRRKSLLDMMFSGQVDGAVILSGKLASFGSRSMLDAGLPLVSIGAPVEGAHQIVTNEEEAIVAGAQALVDLGHRRFLYLPGPDGSHTERARWSALEGLFAGRENDCRIERAASSGFTLENGIASAEAFLRTAPGNRATAVVAVSDEAAIGFLKTVRSAGVDVPKDLSILGFDGIDFADFCEPTLSTIRQPRYEFGLTGARLMIDCLGGAERRPPTRHVLASELLLRDSTGPAPSRKDDHPLDRPTVA